MLETTTFFMLYNMTNLSTEVVDIQLVRKFVCKTSRSRINMVTHGTCLSLWSVLSDFFLLLANHKQYR